MPGQNKTDKSDQQIEKALNTTAKVAESTGRVGISAFAAPAVAVASLIFLAINSIVKLTRAVIQPLPFPGFMKAEMNSLLDKASAKIEKTVKGRGYFRKPSDLLFENTKKGIALLLPERDNDHNQIAHGKVDDADISEDDKEQLVQSAKPAPESHDDLNWQPDQRFTQWAQEYENEQREKDKNHQGGGRE